MKTKWPTLIDSDDSNNLQLNQNEEKSRRFSKLPPVANDDPNAVKIGHFAITKTPEHTTKSESNDESVKEASNELVLSPASLGVNGNSEKSRRFSQLPPADSDSPNAVKLGSKFTMISREDEGIDKNE